MGHTKTNRSCNMSLNRTLLLASLSLTLAAAPVWAKKHQPAQTETTQTVAQAPAKTADEPWLKFTLTTAERERLVSYYQAEPTKKKALPPGLAKKVARGGSLPPGWQKKVARGEVLGYDVYKAAQPVPPVVIQQLPPQPAGTVLVKIEGKIVRLWEATRTIIDILDL